MKKTQKRSELKLTVGGSTHTGNVREANEDTILLEAELGLFAVFDGMGGHSAGDVASMQASATVLAFVREHRDSMAPGDLIAAALVAGSAAVHAEAQRRRDRRGMGTTAVACLLVGEADRSGKKAVIGHVGDSRAYLLRDGRMQQLTQDHTIVAELIATGAITAEEAVRHPYKSVLSRNLGSRPETKVDLVEVPLAAGDRVLLCSDGLNGFASTEAIEQVLGGAESAEHSARDLVELALRGGGGDNVSVITIEAGRQVLAHDTQILQSSGAVAWWQRRSLFLDSVRQLGLAQSPICAVLSEDEAVQIVAGNLCEAIFHDLEQTTSINVWTYAENLTNGWLDQDGEYGALRDLLDILRGAAGEVIADIRAQAAPFATSLDAAVTRTFVVVEMAIGGLLAKRIREMDLQVVKAQATPPAQQARTLTESPTIPYMRAVKIEPPPPAVAECLDKAFVAAKDLLTAVCESVGPAVECLTGVHEACVSITGPVDLSFLAREVYNARSPEENALAALLEALDQARGVHLDVLEQAEFEPEVRSVAIRRASVAHRDLYFGVARLVVDAGRPISDQLAAASQTSTTLRAKLSEGEVKLAQMEREFVTRQSPEETRPGMGQPKNVEEIHE